MSRSPRTVYAASLLPDDACTGQAHVRQASTVRTLKNSPSVSPVLGRTTLLASGSTIAAASLRASSTVRRQRPSASGSYAIVLPARRLDSLCSRTLFAACSRSRGQILGVFAGAARSAAIAGCAMPFWRCLFRYPWAHCRRQASGRKHTTLIMHCTTTSTATTARCSSSRRCTLLASRSRSLVNPATATSCIW